MHSSTGSVHLDTVWGHTPLAQPASHRWWFGRWLAIALLCVLPLLLVLPMAIAGYRLLAALKNAVQGQLFAAADLGLAGVAPPPWHAWVVQFGDALWPWVLGLFHALVVVTSVQGLAMLLLAWRRRKGAVKAQTDVQGWPSLSVLVPAYNEAAVICATVRSLLGSDYAGPLEVIVIDDGSRDGTAALVRQCFDHDARLKVLQKSNGGKASALNLGLAQATGEVVAVIDADTVLHTLALRHLAANFVDPQVGAVAGNMQVGNLISELTRQQAIEYTAANNIERLAQEHLGCITVVPGAIGAYRRSVLTALGGYHADTLAEDADLTVRILRGGWRVVYEERALARTEAPHDFNGFMKQRLRWSFGKLQVVWKHRAVLGSRHCPRLGWIGLPLLLVFNFAVPPLAFVLGGMRWLVLLCVGVGWHADLAMRSLVPAHVKGLLLELVVLALVQRAAVIVSHRRDRRVPGAIVRRLLGWRPALCWVSGTPVRWLMTLALTATAYRSLLRGLSGKATQWNKLTRTASVTVDFGADTRRCT